MNTPQVYSCNVESASRRDFLKAGLAAGVTLATWPLHYPAVLWGATAGPPKRGGILRVRGYDPIHFDPHLTLTFKTHTTLSFVYSRLLRHKVGADVLPGTFTIEPDLAERWEQLDDTTYVFALRQGVSAYIATTFAGKFEGMAYGPTTIAWEPDTPLYGMYAPGQPRNSGHVNDPTLTAMLKEQRRTKDLEARKKLIFDIQRYVAEQQYYVYTNSGMITGTWQPYVKNHAPNLTFDYGSRAAVLWLER